MFTVKNLLILIIRHLAVALIAVSVTLAATIFLSKEITKISDTVALNKKLEAQLKQRTELLGTLEKDAKIIGTNDTKIENAFIPSDNILYFINSLDQLAARKGITQNYRFDTPLSSPFSSPFPISMIAYNNNISANMSGLVDYLTGFSKLPYITKINSIIISSQDKDGIKGLSNISIQGVLYTKTSQ